jgi:hypothetical protein
MEKKSLEREKGEKKVKERQKAKRHRELNK